MPDTLSSIQEMTAAIKGAQAAVGDHLRRAINREFNQLTSYGFEYNKTLEILTEEVLYLNFSMSGKMEAEGNIEVMLSDLRKCDEFSD